MKISFPNKRAFWILCKILLSALLSAVVMGTVISFLFSLEWFEGLDIINLIGIIAISGFVTSLPALILFVWPLYVHFLKKSKTGFWMWSLTGGAMSSVWSALHSLSGRPWSRIMESPFLAGTLLFLFIYGVTGWLSASIFWLLCRKERNSTERQDDGDRSGALIEKG